MANESQLRIAVIGAGASGLIAVVKLVEAGFDDVTIFEKADGLGGTWRDNIYPGLTCDVPSHAYRLSFAPNPDWTQICASGEEILDYLKKTAREFGVDRHIRFNEEVIEARFDDHRWYITTTSGAQGAFDIVITATGVLHHPVYPDIPDLDRFAGDRFHSARWPKSYDWKGKRVGVIGTGSTATQIVSAMAEDVEKLVLFQRTAQWVFPQSNDKIPADVRQQYRENPSHLDAEYRQLLSKINATFAASLVGENPRARAKIVQACEEYLATVRDPVLRAKLTPDYVVGCKRLVMSDTFYEAVQRDNVELVTEKIVRGVPSGIEIAGGNVHELDLIVMATGFDTHKFFRPMKVTGRSGITIDEAWAARNRGYNTVSAPGFPNWFMLGGPSSPIGNFSWLLTAETQFNYVLQLIEKIRDDNLAEIEPTEEACRAFEGRMAEQIPRTVWASGCTSWYVDRGGNIASWPWTFDRFVEDLDRPRWEDFRIVSRAGSLR